MRTHLPCEMHRPVADSVRTHPSPRTAPAPAPLRTMPHAFLPDGGLLLVLRRALATRATSTTTSATTARGLPSCPLCKMVPINVPPPPELADAGARPSTAGTHGTFSVSSRSSSRPASSGLESRLGA